MPKRIVDGEGVWRSSKVRRLKKEHSGEFANLLPLSEANGVFEVDVHKIWSEVYSYNRDHITKVNVYEILKDLVSVGLLLVWEEDDKTWGSWEGVDKPGRLPSSSEQRKYKNLPPDCPVPGPSIEESFSVLEKLSKSF